jgi:large subunit ribosomal protein L13
MLRGDRPTGLLPPTFTGKKTVPLGRPHFLNRQVLVNPKKSSYLRSPIKRPHKKVDSLSYKTLSANKATVTKNWLVVDAEGQTLGRMASQVAKLIRGKHKTSYTPHVNCGDHVIVINAEKIALSGAKMEDKKYVRYTGYPGGQRFSTPASEMKRKPTRVVEEAVRGMLPKNRLGRAMFNSLHVFAGGEHTHEAQKPTVVNLNEIF